MEVREKLSHNSSALCSVLSAKRLVALKLKIKIKAVETRPHINFKSPRLYWVPTLQPRYFWFFSLFSLMEL
mgnify:CR=1 FL=1|jgi:hypothetical protein